MRNIKRITEVMKIWNCKRALGLLKQIYRENLFSAVLSLTVIVLLAVVGVMPSFLIGKIIDMAAAGRIDGLFMLNVGLILALGGGKILEITQEYITAESSISVANSLTDRIMERLMHAETAWLSGQKRGEILQAVSDDVETVKRISVSTLPQFLYMLLVAVTRHDDNRCRFIISTFSKRRLHHQRLLPLRKRQAECEENAGVTVCGM